LAAIQHVTRGAIVGAVNTLERRGLVRRTRSDVDRRLVTVELTDEGRKLIARVQTEWHAGERAVMAGLTRADQQTLARLLRKVAARTREMRHVSR
jgi:DNA-binding MarR family transcriptional regulator